MSVTHVCQRWRAIATADPLLWRDIVSKNPSVEWVKMALERSQPCTLSATIGRDWLSEALVPLYHHAHRITELNIAANDDDDMLSHLTLFRWSDGGFPALTELLLCIDDAEDTLKLKIAAHAPSLHKLTLVGDCVLSARSDIWLQLTELALVNPVVPYSDRRLKALFGRMPRLVDVKLNGCLSTDRYTTKSMPLPSVKRLLITDSIDACTMFLSTFRLPSDCHVTLIPDDDDMLSAASLRALAPHLRATHGAYAHLGVTVDNSEDDGLRQAYIHLGRDATTSCALSILLSAEADARPGADPLTTDLLRVLEALPLEQLVDMLLYLDERTAAPTTRAHWSAVFEGTPHLTLFAVHAPQLSALLGALAPPAVRAEVDTYWRWAKLDNAAAPLLESLRPAAMAAPPVLPRLHSLVLVLTGSAHTPASLRQISHEIAVCAAGRHLAAPHVASMPMVQLGRKIGLVGEDAIFLNEVMHVGQYTRKS